MVPVSAGAKMQKCRNSCRKCLFSAFFFVTINNWILRKKVRARGKGYMLEKQLPYKYKVFDVLKKGILCGEYPPGTVFNERRLSEELGISRTPIREALQMLEHAGWLKMETYKGAVVRELDPEYAEEVGSIRRALEQCAIEQAVKKMDPGDLKKLEEIQEKQKEMLEKYDIQSFIAMDRQFHSCIYEMSHNKELIHLLQNYYDMFQYMGTQALLNTDERRITSIQEHQAVLDAMRTGQPEEAVRAMRYHMDLTMENMRMRMKHRSGEDEKQPQTI